MTLHTTASDPKPAVTPKLRFPEFRDAQAWTEKPLDACLDYEQPTRYLVSDTNYSPSFETPVLTAGKTFILGYTNERHGILSEDLPVIIFDDFTTATQFVDFPFKAKSSAMKILRAKEGTNIKFMYERLQTLSYEVGAHERHWISEFAPMLVSVPQPAEQQKIAECLGMLDQLIGAESQKLDALKAQQKGLMQQLFPRQGETLPRVRLPEFQSASEWDVATVQDLIDKQHIVGHLDGNHGELYPRAEEFSSSGVPYITANDFADGFVSFRRCRYLPEDRAIKFKKGVAKDGDVLFAHNATVGPVAKLTTDLKFVILSTTATYFRCDPAYLSSDFLKFALTSPVFVDQYSRVMAQSTRNQVPITAQRKFFLQIPRLPEQHRISTCLSSLDDLIAAQSGKLEALQTHKRGLMQQLFPSPSQHVEP